MEFVRWFRKIVEHELNGKAVDNTFFFFFHFVRLSNSFFTADLREFLFKALDLKNRSVQ